MVFSYIVFFPYMYCPGNMVFIYRWFSLFVFCPDLGVFSYIYRYFLIYMEYHPFCNVFPIYIQNNTLSFSLFCLEFVYFPINAFSSYIYRKQTLFLFRFYPREYSYIQEVSISYISCPSISYIYSFVLCPDSLYIQLFLYRWFLIYIYME